MEDILKDAEQVLKTHVSPIVLAKIQAMKAQLQNYLNGVIDGMGLQGNFQIDDNTGEIMQIGDHPQPEQK